MANEIFDEMIEFARYAFNKSHATAYALVSYQTAWLKYHYPEYFLCAMFNNLEQEKYKKLIDDCQKLHIKLLPLSINESYYNFVIENGNIRYGFRGIKGLGDVYKGDIEQICNERRSRLYKDIKDFLIRNINVSETVKGIKYSTYRDKFMHSLINTGCFDEMHSNREILIRDYSLEAESRGRLEHLINNLIFPDEPQNIKYNMSKEIEYLDSVISVNLLEEYNDDAYYHCTPISEINEDGNYEIFGQVIESSDRKSKKGNNILILKIHGKDGECTAIAMNKLYNAYNSGILLNSVVRMKVNVSDKGFFINEIHKMDSSTSDCFIDLDTIEKTKTFSKMMDNRMGENRSIKAVILCRYTGKENLIKAKKPIMVDRMLSDEEIDLLKSENIM